MFYVVYCIVNYVVYLLNLSFSRLISSVGKREQLFFAAIVEFESINCDSGNATLTAHDALTFAIIMDAC